MIRLKSYNNANDVVKYITNNDEPIFLNRTIRIVIWVQLDIFNHAENLT